MKKNNLVKLTVSAMILLAANINNNNIVDANDVKEELNEKYAQDIAKGLITSENMRYDSLLYGKEVLNPESDDDGDGLKNKEEIYIYTKSDGKKYYGYNSHPKLIDTDGDGIIDSKDSNKLTWDVSDRDAALFMELSYRDDSYINEVLKNTVNLSQLYENRAEYNVMHKELAKFWKVKKTWHEGSGLDAVLFENTSEYPYLNNGKVHILAIRGTKGSADLDDDLDIFFGKQPGQIASLQKVIDEIKNMPEVKNNPLYFTGHSLGGYLAQAANAISRIDGIAGARKSYTFNAPGIRANLFQSNYFKKIRDKSNEINKDSSATKHYNVTNDLTVGRNLWFSPTDEIGRTDNGHGSRSYFESIHENKFNNGIRIKISGNGEVQKNLNNLEFIDLKEGNIAKKFPLKLLEKITDISIDKGDKLEKNDILARVDLDNIPVNREIKVNIPDLSKLGQKEATVTVTYDDNSITSINIPITVKANKKDLKKSYDESIKELNKYVDIDGKTKSSITNYEQSKKNIEGIILSTKNILNSSDVTQEQVDKEKNELDNALVYYIQKVKDLKLDKSELEKEKENYNNINKELANIDLSNKTPNSEREFKTKKSELDKKYKELLKEIDNVLSSATVASEIKLEANKVRNSIADYKKISSILVNKIDTEPLKKEIEKLENEISLFNNSIIDGKTKDSVAKYKEELGKSKLILEHAKTQKDNGNITLAELNKEITEVTSSKLTLQTAKESLKTDLTKLSELITVGLKKETVLGMTNDSVKKLYEGISKAQKVYELNNPSVDEVRNFEKKIQEAIVNLVVDKEELKKLYTQLIAENNDIDTTNRTPDSINNYENKKNTLQLKETINKANEVIKNTKASVSDVLSTKEEVAKKLDALRETKKLLKFKANKKVLQSVIDELNNAINSVTLDNKTVNSIANYNKQKESLNLSGVIANANSVVNNDNATEEDVSNQTLSIENTLNKLNEYKKILVEKALNQSSQHEH